MASESTTNLSINSEAVILQMFFKISVWCSGDFGTIFKGNFFYRTLTVAASVNGVCQYLSFLNILFNRFCPMEKCVITPHIAYINFFFKLGFTPCKAKQPLQGMELQERKHNEDYRMKEICLQRTNS